MAEKSKFPFFRRKGNRTPFDEPDMADLPRKRPSEGSDTKLGPDKGEPRGKKGAKGTGSSEANAGMKAFLKKRKGEMIRKGK